MNICYLIDVAPERMIGGGQVHLTHLVRELELRITNYELRIFGASQSHPVIRFIWMLFVVPQVLLHHFIIHRFDLIHAHSIPAMAAGKVLSTILGIPIVVTIHGNSLSLKDGPRHSPRTVLFRFLESVVLTKIHYDAQISVSRDFLKIPNVNKKVVYIPNGVDAEKYKKVEKGRKKYKKEQYILFVGRKDDPVKGFSVLHEAMRSVKKQFPTVRLIVADGSVPSFRLPQLYQTSDLLVIPSLSEGFPLILLEAWASRLPVVATSVGEVPYVVKNDINGFLVPPRDAEALAKGIIRALKSKNLAKIGKSGYNSAKKYRWSSVAKRTLDVYGWVLS